MPVGNPYLYQQMNNFASPIVTGNPFIDEAIRKQQMVGGPPMTQETNPAPQPTPQQSSALVEQRGAPPQTMQNPAWWQVLQQMGGQQQGQQGRGMGMGMAGMGGGGPVVRPPAALIDPPSIIQPIGVHAMPLNQRLFGGGK